MHARMRSTVILALALVLGACGQTAPPDATCHGLSKTIDVSPSGIPPEYVSVSLPPSGISLSAWVYSEATGDGLLHDRFQNVLNLRGRDVNGSEIYVGLAQPGYLPPWEASDVFLVYNDIWKLSPYPYGYPFSPYNLTLPTMEWTLLTLSIGRKFITVFVNESVAWHVERSAAIATYVEFSQVSFEKPYAVRSGSAQTYAGIQLYERALVEADVVARVNGDPSACSPAPPPSSPPPPFAQSPPSPPFAPAPPASACISDFTPAGTFSEACYVVLPQPRLVCNGTRVVVGCGRGAVARMRFPGRSDIRAISAGACDLLIDTVSSTTVASMVVEIACTDARCEPRPIMAPSFSLSGQCETVPVVEKDTIDVPYFNASTARIVFPSKRPMNLSRVLSEENLEYTHSQLENSVLYLPLPEILCPGSVVYAWLPRTSPKPWVVGCGASGVCAPMFDYPAQNASIPYNSARINGLFEASSDVTSYGVARLRMAYTGREPLVSAPNTALQLSLLETADDVYYGISESMAADIPNHNIIDANFDYSNDVDRPHLQESLLKLLYKNLADTRFAGAAIEGPTQCERIQNQTAWCIPQSGVSTCAGVCAQSHVKVSADRLSADTVITVFGVVRLTVDNPSWAGMTVSDTTADVECTGTCGMAALTYLWTTPPGGCPPSGTNTAASGRFLCASNAAATHGLEPTPLCNVTVKAGQVVELWAEYVSFHSATITIANETFVLEAPAVQRQTVPDYEPPGLSATVPQFPEDDAEINPGCPITRYNSFITTKRLAPLQGSTWSGASNPLDAGVYSLQLQSLERRVILIPFACQPSDVVATIHAVVRYPDPPVKNVTLCTSTSPCVVSDTTLASVSTYTVSIQSDGGAL